MWDNKEYILFAFEHKFLSVSWNKWAGYFLQNFVMCKIMRIDQINKNITKKNPRNLG